MENEKNTKSSLSKQSHYIYYTNKCFAFLQSQIELCYKENNKLYPHLTLRLGVPVNNSNRAFGRIRTLSQSSCISVAEQNETDVLILQQSPVHPSWTATLYESQSDISLVCETPPICRSRRTSKGGDDCKIITTPISSGSRPSSLLVSTSGDGFNVPENCLVSDQTNKSQHVSAASLLSNLSFNSIMGNISATGGKMTNDSSTTVMSASVDTLARIRGYKETGDASSDDESTPLVSEISSPSLGPGGRNSGASNKGFGTVESPASSEISPMSIKSISVHDITSSSDSISKVLEGVEGFCNFGLVESPKGREMSTVCDDKVTTIHGGKGGIIVTTSLSLSRQDAVENDYIDISKSSWNDPETTV